MEMMHPSAASHSSLKLKRDGSDRAESELYRNSHERIRKTRGFCRSAMCSCERILIYPHLLFAHTDLVSKNYYISTCMDADI
jgi:hypothetical protein